MLKRRERCDFFSAPQMEFDLDAQFWMLHGFFLGSRWIGWVAENWCLVLGATTSEVVSRVVSAEC